MDWFDRLHSFLAKHKAAMIVVGVVLFAASIFAMTKTTYSDDILALLPVSEVVREHMRFLKESDVSDKVALTVSMKNAASTTHDLIAESALFSKRLTTLPDVAEVTDGLPSKDLAAVFPAIAGRVPSTFSEEDSVRARGLVTDDSISERVRTAYKMLLNPASGAVAPMVRQDPLGLTKPSLDRLQALSAALGYRVDIVDGRYLSTDRKYALIVLKVKVPMTDAAGSRRMLASLRALADEFPSMHTEIVCGHAHTVSNEKVIKRDVSVTMTLVAVSMFLIIVLCFRHPSSLLIFAIPFVSLAVAASLTGLVYGKLSYMVYGFAAALAGIADDYSIHAFTAWKRSGVAGVRAVCMPILLAATATMSAFGVFFFSSVKGYAQLAFFSIISILFCLICALFVLPHFWPTFSRGANAPAIRPFIARSPRLLMLSWILFLAAAGYATSQVRFESDIRQFDGSDRSVIDAERTFKTIWGGSDPGIIAVEAKSEEEALRMNDEVYRRVTADATISPTSIAPLFPSKVTTEENLSRWHSFWSQQNVVRVKLIMSREAAKYGFSPDAFSPFFASITGRFDAPSDNAALTGMRDHFVKTRNGSTRVLTFFPDNGKMLEKVRTAVDGMSGVHVISRKFLGDEISRTVKAEFVRLALLAFAVIALFVFLLIRDPLLSCIALVPVFSAVLAIPAVLWLCHMSLNAVVLMSGIIIIGLCVDFGIFVVEHCRHDHDTDTYRAVTYSVLTTIVGGVALLCAKHPVMFSVGMTLTVGITVGYVSSFVVIPSLYKAVRG